tara:strand:+ start:281 stop:481 length:201 start_codon:yes stop_codon:yes gene_type:complete
MGNTKSKQPISDHDHKIMCDTLKHAIINGSKHVQLQPDIKRLRKNRKTNNSASTLEEEFKSCPHNS